MAQNLTREPQVLVLGSFYQGFPFWGYFIFDPQPFGDPPWFTHHYFEKPLYTLPGNNMGNDTKLLAITKQGFLETAWGTDTRKNGLWFLGLCLATCFGTPPNDGLSSWLLFKTNQKEYSEKRPDQFEFSMPVTATGRPT